jgi:hypothetical protein
MSKEQKDLLKQMIYDYGNSDLMLELSLVYKEMADEQSDMGLKKNAASSSLMHTFLKAVGSGILDAEEDMHIIN